MKKESLKSRIGIFIFCVIMGVLLAIQFGDPESGKMYVSASAIDEYKVQIETELQNVESIKAQIEEKKALLEEYSKSSRRDDNKVIEEKLKSELESYQILSGNERVHGSGAKIVIDDGTRELMYGEDINNILVHDIDILMVINELKKAKAEAITVNGHRITPFTSIICSGYTVRMDGMTYARPFEIIAIGDFKRMSNALLAPEGYGRSLRDWGVQFSIEYVEDIVIPSADWVKTFKYANPSIQESEENE